MGVRLWLKEQQKGAMVVAVALAVLGIGVLVWRMAGSVVARPIGQSVWFTIDDGKTWFAESSTKLPPFEHQGKTAYRCYVYTCDGGRTAFVSHLERFTPEITQRLKTGGAFDPMLASAIEVKEPGTGDTGWVKQSDPKAAAIMRPICPDDPNKLPEPVLP